MAEDFEQKIRVLIVDDIPETRENVRKLLYFERDIEVVGAAVDGTEGIELAKKLRPDIVLMDINMPDIDGISATQSICQSVPEVQVIMMSVQGETDYLRRSMLAGAREFLVKPFSADELIASIRRVYQLKPKMAPVQPGAPRPPSTAGRREYEAVVTARQGRIISVYSPKGGSGCSTISVNLAIALRNLNNGEDRVALVDGDLQFGDIAVLLNMQATRTIADLVPYIDNLDIDLLSDMMLTHSSGMKILLAPPRPDTAEMVTAEHVREILENLKPLYDYIVVDTSTFLDDVVLTTMEMSDQILLIVTPDIPTIKNAKLLLELLEALDHIDRTKLVINKVSRSDGITDKDIMSHIKHSVWASIPRDNGSVVAAANQGIPLIIGRQKSPVARGIVQLADLIDTETAEAEKALQKAAHAAGEPGSRTLLGRIFG
jgi:pilus assembly protein CpaE